MDLSSFSTHSRVVFSVNSALHGNTVIALMSVKAKYQPSTSATFVVTHQVCYPNFYSTSFYSSVHFIYPIHVLYFVLLYLFIKIFYLLIFHFRFEEEC